MRILSIERIGPAFFLWIEDGPFYKKLRVEADGAVKIFHEAPRSNFKSYRHFIGVMGKFNPDTLFKIHPVKIKSLTIRDLDQIAG